MAEGVIFENVDPPEAHPPAIRVKNDEKVSFLKMLTRRRRIHPSQGLEKCLNRLPMAPHGLILSLGEAGDIRKLFRPLFDSFYVFFY